MVGTEKLMRSHHPFASTTNGGDRRGYIHNHNRYWRERCEIMSVLVMFVLLSVGCKRSKPTSALDPVLSRSRSTGHRTTKGKTAKSKSSPHKTLPFLTLTRSTQRDQILAKKKKKIHVVAPPTFRDKKIFPCTACHTDEPNLKRRPLVRKHKNHILRHGGGHIWCYHCHSPKNIDKLHLSDGTPISYKRSFMLCFQCHGDKARDWVAGVHGRRTGLWKGTKRYLLCTHCHDPHDPKPRKIKPMPMPIAPHLLQPKARH